MIKPISIAETSQVLGMSVPTVRQQLDAGTLSSLIINGKRQVILPASKVLSMASTSNRPRLTLLSNSSQHDAPPDMAA